MKTAQPSLGRRYVSAVQRPVGAKRARSPSIAESNSVNYQFLLCCNSSKCDGENTPTCQPLQRTEDNGGTSRKRNAEDENDLRAQAGPTGYGGMQDGERRKRIRRRTAGSTARSRLLRVAPAGGRTPTALVRVSHDAHAKGPDRRASLGRAERATAAHRRRAAVSRRHRAHRLVLPHPVVSARPGRHQPSLLRKFLDRFGHQVAQHHVFPHRGARGRRHRHHPRGRPAPGLRKGARAAAGRARARKARGGPAEKRAPGHLGPRTLRGQALHARTHSGGVRAGIAGRGEPAHRHVRAENAAVEAEEP